MSQLIRRLPIAPIHLAVLLLALYFVLYRFSVLTMLMLGGLITLLWFRQGKIVTYKLLPILACFLLLFGFQRFKIVMDEASAPAEVSQLLVKPDTIQVNGDSLTFRARSSGRLYTVFYQLKSEKEQAYFKHLSSLVDLEVEATVSEPEGQRNFNGFDYRDYLRTQGIYRTVKISHIIKIQKRFSWNPLDWLSVLRRKALVYIKEQFPNPMRHYMTGLLFGELDKEFDQMSDLYSSLGIIHLFALSGMQVGFFIDKLRYLFLRLGLRKEIVDWMQIPFSFVYAGLTGFSISVNRSLLQKILANLGVRKLDNMACTILVSFFIMPHFLLTTGGILSFAYAFLLTVFDFEDLTYYKRIAVESLAISLGILPLLIYYFYSFQPLSILLTFLFSFVFDSILLPGLSLVFLLAPFIPMTQFNVFFVWLEMCIHWVADLGLKPFVFGKPTAVLLLLLMAVLLLLYDRYQSWKYCLLLIGLAALLFFIIKHPVENEVTLVDVGQGDSIFLRDIRGRTVLIDVGGRLSVASKEEWQRKESQSNAERTLIPYLYSRGVSKIDYLVLTHAHADHMGDLVDLARKMDIGAIYISEGSAASKELTEKLRKIAIRPHLVRIGDTIPIGDGFLRVLYPEQKGDGGNNDSIVLYGSFLQTRFLFTGDLEDGELALMKCYPQLPVDVLKVGHHGSRGSSYPEFLDYISPKIALISAGKHNRYKHPHYETLARFQERKIQVFRTDEQGAIRFRGWKKWRIETVR
ncbi:DNA internalization-related competence protein ComEC/Rec2 [Streptococcus sp. zg-86]|uniref:DNA internalization-related competence protein ComEC/Rec2 n=1 Tax=Streptococcus zhangguiae TaxID=2664091 RepID=A0A6I4RHX8_9STRE|nr:MULTISPECIES: DNA internalization-related competence protein ComEC/Rec2 [unclassified Streptococcus]MTB64123.1 DNA internalization-related competence protein ComEC/Rec2 [Streptococcus sp. zg-86]MTB90551.1 DNA internalization-related competence protein ComEC/Rec2 [Streptococcus sp. zg-36]MWV56111.1 DNA internalization-related competence protein ComEC/Rec2 [Streptococcus sp. zg-70]QTH48264.1 DNA internalization-related competence protein ComEC/Rec2 [Streptococcus sp. zg-86]